MFRFLNDPLMWYEVYQQPLEYTVVRPFVRQTVRQENKHHTDYRFEQSYCCTKAHFTIQNRCPIDEGVNNIAFIIDKRIV